MLTIGAAPQLNFHNVLPECGNVFSITQDDDLNMWLGTNTGFYRYDGYNSTKYTFGFYFPVADANRIYHTGIYRDLTGGIWASYRNLYKFDRNTLSFKQVECVNEDGITDVVDYNGVILLACDSGIKAIGRDSQSPEDLPEGLIGLRPYKFYIDGLNLYVVTRDYKVVLFPALSARPEFVSDISFFKNYPVDIAVNEGTVWVAADGGGIASVNEQGDCRRFTRSNQAGALCSNFVRSIAFDSRGNLWASTGSGLSIMDKSGRFTTYQASNEAKLGLSKNSLIKIFRDSDDGMWVGTVGGGVDYCNSSSPPFSTVDLGPRFEDVVGPLAEDKDGSIWIGTSRSGVFHYYPDRDEYSQILFSASLEMNDVRTIYFSADGKSTYFGFSRNGIAVLDRKTGKVSVVASPFSSSLSIMEILEDADGYMWLGTSDGIYLYDKDKRIGTRAGGQPSMMFVNSMKLTPDGTCLVCAYDKLFSCRLCKGNDGPQVCDMQEDKRFESSRSIRQVGDDGMFVVSDCGLYICDSLSILTYSVDNGLSSNQVSSAGRDAGGLLWVATRNGLNAVNEFEGTVTRFYDFDGLPSNYFSENSCLSASDGSMYFGTVNGLVRFNPSSVDYQRPSHEPHVAYVSVSGKMYNAQNSGVYVIDPGTSFSIVYGVCNYSSLDRSIFFYRLLPSGQKWEKAGPGNSITFSNLKHGKYTFELKAENAYGNISGTSTSISIIVKPFWYQSIPAKVLYLIALVLLASYCAVKVRNSVRSHYERKIKHVEALSAEAILEHKARTISSHYLSIDELAVLEKVIMLVQSRLQDPAFSIEQLAGDMCMSRSNLHRKIKSMTGKSATDLLQKFRMERAAELLTQTDLSVEEISEMVGYSTASYFIQAFKKYYHKTPGKLR